MRMLNNQWQCYDPGEGIRPSSSPGAAGIPGLTVSVDPYGLKAPPLSLQRSRTAPCCPYLYCPCILLFIALCLLWLPRASSPLHLFSFLVSLVSDILGLFLINGTFSTICLSTCQMSELTLPTNTRLLLPTLISNSNCSPGKSTSDSLIYSVNVFCIFIIPFKWITLIICVYICIYNYLYITQISEKQLTTSISTLVYQTVSLVAMQ